MSKYFKRPTAPREKPFEADELKALNNAMVDTFALKLGIDLSEGTVPKTNEVPRIFLMDEKGTRTLEDDKVKVGSPQFWELM